MQQPKKTIVEIPKSQAELAAIANELTNEASAFVARGRIKFLEKFAVRAGNRPRAATVYANACLLEAMLIYRDLGGMALAEQMASSQIEALKNLDKEKENGSS